MSSGASRASAGSACTWASTRAAARRDVVDAVQAEELGEDGPPGVVGRGLLDGVARAGQAPHTRRAPARAGRPAAATCRCRPRPRPAPARPCRPRAPQGARPARPAQRQRPTIAGGPVGLAGRLDRPIDGDRLGLALDQDRGQRLERKRARAACRSRRRTGSPSGRRPASAGPPGSPRRRSRVFAPHVAAHRAAERPPGGDADRAAHPQLHQGPASPARPGTPGPRRPRGPAAAARARPPA